MSHYLRSILGSCKTTQTSNICQTFIRPIIPQFPKHNMTSSNHRNRDRRHTQHMLSHYLDPTTTILWSHCEDDTTYNDRIFKTIFAPNDIIHVTLDTNATEADNVLEWLKDLKFDQVHHVVVGALVMFTSNINVAKGVVNGAPQRSHQSIETLTVWSQPLVFSSSKPPHTFILNDTISNTNTHMNNIITKHHSQLF